MAETQPTRTQPVGIDAASNAGGGDAWTTARLLAWIAEAFAKRDLDAPRLSAEILLEHVLGMPRLKLYLDPQRVASAEELAALRGLVGRALKDEPVQYLTGQAWFFGLQLAVDKRVLIPRPCTETIVEAVLQDVRRRSLASPVIADICTGSGCIALALGSQLRQARVLATDISADALAVAEANLQRVSAQSAGKRGMKPLGAGEVLAALRAAGVTDATPAVAGKGPPDSREERTTLADRLTLHQGDLLSALPESMRESFDFIVSNPPYIPDHEWEAVPRNVKQHEPVLALRGGADGLQYVAPIIRDAAKWLKPGGLLLIEIAACTSGEAQTFARAESDLTSVEILRDLEGHERVLSARRR